MSQINTELGRSASASISLMSASVGNYTNINTNSTIRPNVSAPHAMSEWRGYNHSATPPLLATQTWSTPGTYSYTVPAGATLLRIFVIGGGGGGAGSYYYDYNESCDGNFYNVGWIQPAYGAGAGVAAVGDYQASGLHNAGPLTIIVGAGGSGGSVNSVPPNGYIGGTSQVYILEELWNEELQQAYNDYSVYISASGGWPSGWYTNTEVLYEGCQYTETRPSVGTTATGKAISGPRLWPGTTSFSNGGAGSMVPVTINPSYSYKSIQFLGGNGADRTVFQGFSASGGIGNYTVAGTGGAPGAGGSGGGTGTNGDQYWNGGQGGAGRVKIEVY